MTTEHNLIDLFGEGEPGIQREILFTELLSKLQEKIPTLGLKTKEDVQKAIKGGNLILHQNGLKVHQEVQKILDSCNVGDSFNRLEYALRYNVVPSDATAQYESAEEAILDLMLFTAPAAAAAVPTAAEIAPEVTHWNDRLTEIRRLLGVTIPAPDIQSTDDIHARVAKYKNAIRAIYNKVRTDNSHEKIRVKRLLHSLHGRLVNLNGLASVSGIQENDILLNAAELTELTEVPVPPTEVAPVALEPADNHLKIVSANGMKGIFARLLGLTMLDRPDGKAQPLLLAFEEGNGKLSTSGNNLIPETEIQKLRYAMRAARAYYKSKKSAPDSKTMLKMADMIGKLNIVSLNPDQSADIGKIVGHLLSKPDELKDITESDALQDKIQEFCNNSTPTIAVNALGIVITTLSTSLLQGLEENRKLSKEPNKAKEKAVNDGRLLTRACQDKCEKQSVRDLEFFEQTLQFQKLLREMEETKSKDKDSILTAFRNFFNYGENVTSLALDLEKIVKNQKEQTKKTNVKKLIRKAINATFPKLLEHGAGQIKTPQIGATPEARAIILNALCESTVTPTFTISMGADEPTVTCPYYDVSELAGITTDYEKATNVIWAIKKLGDQHLIKLYEYLESSTLGFGQKSSRDDNYHFFLYVRHELVSRCPKEDSVLQDVQKKLIFNGLQHEIHYAKKSGHSFHPSQACQYEDLAEQKMTQLTADDAAALVSDGVDLKKEAEALLATAKKVALFTEPYYTVHKEYALAIIPKLHDAINNPNQAVIKHDDIEKAQKVFNDMAAGKKLKDLLEQSKSLCTKSEISRFSTTKIESAAAPGVSDIAWSAVRNAPNTLGYLALGAGTKAVVGYGLGASAAATLGWGALPILAAALAVPAAREGLARYWYQNKTGMQAWEGLLKGFTSSSIMGFLGSGISSFEHDHGYGGHSEGFLEDVPTPLVDFVAAPLVSSLLFQAVNMGIKFNECTKMSTSVFWSEMGTSIATSMAMNDGIQVLGYFHIDDFFMHFFLDDGKSLQGAYDRMGISGTFAWSKAPSVDDVGEHSKALQESMANVANTPIKDISEEDAKELSENAAKLEEDAQNIRACAEGAGSEEDKAFFTKTADQLEKAAAIARTTVLLNHAAHIDLSKIEGEDLKALHDALGSLSKVEGESLNEITDAQAAELSSEVGSVMTEVGNADGADLTGDKAKSLEEVKMELFGKDYGWFTDSSLYTKEVANQDVKDAGEFAGAVSEAEPANPEEHSEEITEMNDRWDSVVTRGNTALGDLNTAMNPEGRVSIEEAHENLAAERDTAQKALDEVNNLEDVDLDKEPLKSLRENLEHSIKLADDLLAVQELPVEVVGHHVDAQSGSGLHFTKEQLEEVEDTKQALELTEKDGHGQDGQDAHKDEAKKDSVKPDDCHHLDEQDRDTVRDARKEYNKACDFLEGNDEQPLSDSKKDIEGHIDRLEAQKQKLDGIDTEYLTKAEKTHVKDEQDHIDSALEEMNRVHKVALKLEKLEGMDPDDFSGGLKTAIKDAQNKLCKKYTMKELSELHFESDGHTSAFEEAYSKIHHAAKVEYDKAPIWERGWNGVKSLFVDDVMEMSDLSDSDLSDREEALEKMGKISFGDRHEAGDVKIKPESIDEVGYQVEKGKESSDALSQRLGVHNWVTDQPIKDIDEGQLRDEIADAKVHIAQLRAIDGTNLSPDDKAALKANIAHLDALCRLGQRVIDATDGELNVSDLYDTPEGNNLEDPAERSWADFTPDGLSPDDQQIVDEAIERYYKFHEHLKSGKPLSEGRDAFAKDAAALRESHEALDALLKDGNDRINEETRQYLKDLSKQTKDAQEEATDSQQRLDDIMKQQELILKQGAVYDDTSSAKKLWHGVLLGGSADQAGEIAKHLEHDAELDPDHAEVCKKDKEAMEAIERLHRDRSSTPTPFDTTEHTKHLVSERIDAAHKVNQELQDDFTKMEGRAVSDILSDQDEPDLKKHLKEHIADGREKLNALRAIRPRNEEERAAIDAQADTLEHAIEYMEGVQNLLDDNESKEMIIGQAGIYSHGRPVVSSFFRDTGALSTGKLGHTREASFDLRFMLADYLAERAKGTVIEEQEKERKELLTGGRQ